MNACRNKIFQFVTTPKITIFWRNLQNLTIRCQAKIIHWMSCWKLWLSWRVNDLWQLWMRNHSCHLKQKKKNRIYHHKRDTVQESNTIETIHWWLQKMQIQLASSFLEVDEETESIVTITEYNATETLVCNQIYIGKKLPWITYYQFGWKRPCDCFKYLYLCWPEFHQEKFVRNWDNMVPTSSHACLGDGCSTMKIQGSVLANERAYNIFRVE